MGSYLCVISGCVQLSHLFRSLRKILLCLINLNICLIWHRVHRLVDSTLTLNNDQLCVFGSALASFSVRWIQFMCMARDFHIRPSMLRWRIFSCFGLNRIFIVKCRTQFSFTRFTIHNRFNSVPHKIRPINFSWYIVFLAQDNFSIFGRKFKFYWSTASNRSSI